MQGGSSTNGANNKPPATTRVAPNQAKNATPAEPADPPPTPSEPTPPTPNATPPSHRTNRFLRPFGSPAKDSSAAAPDPANRTATEAALVNAARAAGWLARRGWQVARRLPAGELAERQLLRAEVVLITELRRAGQTVTAELRRRRELSGVTTPGFAWRTTVTLDPAVTDPALTGPEVTGPAEQVTVVRPLNGHVEPLRAGMAELLGRSAIAGTDQARDYLYATILRQLLPDEARMLAALADGAARPVVHVATRATLTGTQRLALENASTLGRDAGLTVAEHVPFHLTRLHRFGLVDIGPEDPDLADQYAILIADDLVRTAVRAAKHAKVIRRAVVLSELGHRFWTACDPLSTKD